MIPLAQRLGGQHATVFGARALILLPTRELALQILKVGKELTRGWHSNQGEHACDGNDGDSKKSQGLRWSLIVGGEGLEEQFEMVTDNPDVFVKFSNFLAIFFLNVVNSLELLRPLVVYYT